MMLLRWLRRIIPKSWRQPYHYVLALGAAWRFGFPSKKLIAIAITGTDGKTTTATMIADILRSAGFRVGLSTSALVRVGEKEWLNESHMTMPGRTQLQKLLADMVKEKCEYAVIEASSEGIAQHRLLAVEVDVAVITNISNEHLEAHGSFEKYRTAKGKLFEHLRRYAPKTLKGKKISKVIVANADDENASYFLGFPADQYFATSFRPSTSLRVGERRIELVTASDVQLETTAIRMNINDHEVTVPLLGRFNAANALQATAVALTQGMSWDKITKGLASLRPVPGRMQIIETHQPWSVVVDYALTPAALESLYRSWPNQKIIAIFGAAGGGRDIWKRPKLGEIAAKYAKHIILTTDDPYDEDPAQIAADIMNGIPKEKQSIAQVILDRREAIRAALQLAQSGDVVAITGMGSETSMNLKGGKKMPWSDVEAVEAELHQPQA